jgi:hypothetical protein
MIMIMIMMVTGHYYHRDCFKLNSGPNLRKRLLVQVVRASPRPRVTGPGLGPGRGGMGLLRWHAQAVLVSPWHTRPAWPGRADGVTVPGRLRQLEYEIPPPDSDPKVAPSAVGGGQCGRLRLRVIIGFTESTGNLNSLAGDLPR